MIYPTQFWTSKGPILFNVWDTVGHVTFAKMPVGFFLQADCAIIMIDVTSFTSCSNTSKWYDIIGRRCEDIPVVIVGNKVDVVKCEVEVFRVIKERFPFFGNEELFCCGVSAKTAYNFSKPFLC